jgi:DNA-directed RNA polymerase alpha subunit
MELTLRTSKALLAAGVTTREQLAEMSDADILKTPNLGRKALVEIRDALARTP